MSENLIIAGLDIGNGYVMDDYIMQRELPAKR